MAKTRLIQYQRGGDLFIVAAKREGKFLLDQARAGNDLKHYDRVELTDFAHISSDVDFVTTTYHKLSNTLDGSVVRHAATVV